LSLHSSGGERAPNEGLGGHCDEAAAETVAAAETSPIGTPQTADNGVAPLAKTQQRREAEQFARDMQQARDVLGLDSSAAALFVQSLRLEKNLENLWMQTTFLSEKRHRQSLRAARHDPNWLEKFHALRDQSYYWNLAGGGGGRLLWEVIAIQQLARGILPVWQYYYYHSSDTETVLGNINSNGNSNNNNNNSEQFDRWIASFLRDSVASILAQVCDCGTRTGSGPSVSAAAATTTAATTSHAQSTMVSWMMTIMTMTTTMIPTTMMTTTTTTTSSSSSSSSSSTVVSLLPGFLEHWSCYGYCVLSASTLLVSTIVLHHGLRLLSVPSSVHHFVNLASVALIYGPHRTLSLVFATVARTVVALHIPLPLPLPIPSGSSSSTILSENDSHSHTHIRLGCSILLVSHWVILPLVSWIRITTLCRSVESRANDSDSVYVDVDVDLDFENTLREGRDKLKRWKREQTTVRYLLLSVYSALVLWENSRIDNTVVRVVDS